MIRDSKKDAILELKRTGMSLRKIARTLKVSRNTITKVLKDPDEASPHRESRYEEHVPLIHELFRECRGNAVRVAEELESRHQIRIPYQSLTWIMRKHEIRKRKKRRAGQYHFKPGQEMQHDTSPHQVTIDGKKVSTQCASLTLAFSRKLFIQYYPCFTRFECKVFLSKAFDFMDGACSRCIVDNTSVIVAAGTGPDALIAPEMKYFADMYQTGFEAHAVGDANRSARVERPFHFVENNFLPGRTFVNWHDLNRQAIDWCRNTSDKTFKRALGMIPDEAYIIEKPYLIDLPPYQPPVYMANHRVVDIEGYVHLDTNRYSVPEALIGKTLEVQKHWRKVIVYEQNRKVAEHDRILDKRDTRTTQPGHHVPIRRKKDPRVPSKEEQLLVGNDAVLDAYVAELKKRSHGRGMVKLRRLLHLQRTYPGEPFLKAIKQALKYGLFDLSRLENIILDYTAGDFFDLS
jgi:transposase